MTDQPGRRLGQRARDSSARLVGQNAEIGHHRAEPLQQRAQQIAVGVVDGGGAAWAPRLYHLVTGREDRDLQPPANAQFGQAERRRQRDVLRLQHGAGRQYDAARRHVLAGKPAVGAELQARRHGDALAFGAHVLLHEHGIGARRHRRAGENPDGLAGLERRLGARAGGDAAGDREGGFAGGVEIGMAHDIAVDRGIIDGGRSTGALTSAAATRERASRRATCSFSPTGEMRSPINRLLLQGK